MHSSDLLSKDNLLLWGGPTVVFTGKVCTPGIPANDRAQQGNWMGHCCPMQNFSNEQSLLWVSSSVCLELLRTTLQSKSLPTPLSFLVPLLHGVRSVPKLPLYPS